MAVHGRPPQAMQGGVFISASWKPWTGGVAGAEAFYPAKGRIEVHAVRPLHACPQIVVFQLGITQPSRRQGELIGRDAPEPFRAQVL